MARASETEVDIDRAVSVLDVMSRHHFSWISESFVHVLILREWGEREISKRIDEEYKREVPRCFRIVERILELGGRPSLEAEREAYVRHLPTAGRTVAGMIERERTMIGSFNAALDNSIESLSNAGEAAGAAIAKEARSNRAIYLDWIARAADASNLRNSERKLRSVSNGSRPHWIALSRLYAHLQPAVEESCVHMLLLRHEGHTEASEQTWRDSYAYMLQAAEIVRLFARRNWALELTNPEVSGDVEEPAIAHSAQRALESHRNRLTDLAEVANATATVLSQIHDPDVEAIPRSMLRYVQARLKGKPGDPPRPARSIDKMLGDHVYRLV